MKTLPEVEKAKRLMNEAMHWSVMKWLREKKNVRKIADQANAALDELSNRVERAWPANVRAAYEALEGHDADPPARRKTKEQTIDGRAVDGRDSNGRAAASRCRQADDAAIRARMLAEETFDRAERTLSPSLAREGCTKAILSWELKEKAIRLAENVVRLGTL